MQKLPDFDLTTLKEFCDAGAKDACARYHAALTGVIVASAIVFAVTALACWAVFFRTGRNQAGDTPKYPTFRNFVAQLLAFSLMIVAVDIPLVCFFPRMFMQDMTGLAVVQFLIWPVFLFLCWRRTKAARTEVFSMKRVSARLLCALPFLACGLMILCSELENFTRIVLHFKSLVNRDEFAAMFSGPMLVVTALLGPILEELYFRGLVLRGLKMNHGQTRALLITSVCFGLIHGNPPQIAPAICVGLIFGWLTLKSGSLVPGIVLHVLYNSTLCVSQYLPIAAIQGFSTSPDIQQYQPLWFDAIGVVLTVASVYWISRAFAPAAQQPLEMKAAA